ncbi:MAG: tetratricopeptide repeat protein, partial [Syntrophobacteraceae bacterium]
MGKSKALLLIGVLLISVGGCASGGSDPYSRAVEHYGRGRINESISEYQHAIRQNPANPLPRFNLAVIYQDQGRLDEAEKLYRSIVSQHPEFASAWSNLASIQEKRGDNTGAEESYRLAVE